eukprot:TRINITY_DN1547_c0_g1_i1.p4 TRINITY_DN1547_c0_g1~~TRINITY_DN1547_c0_g1_i1.p4  ORF type:complete len:162 (+),score=0.25 TRINITY_DN1547_c0_g1_i1:646-1131(+)
MSLKQFLKILCVIVNRINFFNDLISDEFELFVFIIVMICSTVQKGFRQNFKKIFRQQGFRIKVKLSCLWQLDCGCNFSYWMPNHENKNIEFTKENFFLRFITLKVCSLAAKIINIMVRDYQATTPSSTGGSNFNFFNNFLVSNVCLFKCINNRRIIGGREE